jgi:hypothetical protein
LISKKFEKEIVFKSSVLAWIRIRNWIRIKPKCWIRIRIKLTLLTTGTEPVVYAGEDDSDLYLEEREAALRAAQEEKRKVHVTIPGMLNPHEITEEMQD